MKRLLLLGATLTLAACNATVPHIGGTPIALSLKQTEAVKRDLAKSLKDPESARFGTIHASDTKDGKIVCGFVNAKNSFGGYTGEKLFMGNLAEANGSTSFLVAGAGGDENSQVAMQKICRSYDLPV